MPSPAQPHSAVSLRRQVRDRARRERLVTTLRALGDTEVGRELGRLGGPIVGSGRSGTAAVWDVGTGRKKYVVEGPEETIDCLAISPNGRLLVMAE